MPREAYQLFVTWPLTYSKSGKSFSYHAPTIRNGLHICVNFSPPTNSLKCNSDNSPVITCGSHDTVFTISTLHIASSMGKQAEWQNSSTTSCHIRNTSYSTRFNFINTSSHTTYTLNCSICFCCMPFDCQNYSKKSLTNFQVAKH